MREENREILSYISYDCNLEFVLGRIQDEFVMNRIT